MDPRDGANDPTFARSLEQVAVHELFVRYADEFNRGLRGEPDMRAMAALYAEAFVGSAPAGVIAGHNDAEFSRVTAEGFQRYRAIGMKRMVLEGVASSNIDPLHALVQTQWQAVYAVDGGEKAIRFSNAYLVRADAQGAAKVFGWITGDEDEAMRRHGIDAHPAQSA